MTFTRSVLVTTPEQEEVDSVWQARPFKLQVGDIDVMLTYKELSKLISDADGEIRDYLGENT